MTDTLERVKTYKQFIGGEFVDAADGRTADVINPANDQVDRESSRPARPRTSIAPSGRPRRPSRPGRRRRRRTARCCCSSSPMRSRAEADELGRLESANAGKPVGAAIDEIGVCVDLFRFFAGAARVMDGLAANEFVAGHTSIIRRDPIGVVASIAPWNYPLYMATWKLGPALATGNTVVLKPSARTPLSALAFAEILAEIFPPGVVNVLSGSGADIGDALVGHPTVRMVSITGDTVTGKRVAKIAADTVKRLHLELGGKAPIIVFDDADVDLAAETLRFAGYWNAGQDCTAATRVIAGPAVYDQFVSALADQVRTIKWGDPAEGDDIEMGSLIAQAQADKVQGMVDRARGERRGRGRWRAPGSGRRLLHADRHRRPGPEVGDHPGRDLRPGRHRPALQRRGPGDRLGQRHARTGSRHRSSRPTSARRCGSPRRSSSATSGSTSTSRSRPRRPHGGVKQSGWGKDGSKYALEDYTFVKHVMINTGT